MINMGNNRKVTDMFHRETKYDSNLVNSKFFDGTLIGEALPLQSMINQCIQKMANP
jgi:hypothetical protein